MVRCSFCDKEAEFVDDAENPQTFFCREHAREWLLGGKAQFLPRIDRAAITRNQD